jgi:Transposase DDE domain
MSVTDASQTVVETEHALLVAYGRFAQQIGLSAALEQVAFKMKTIEHSPQDKTLELLAHVLAGGMHVNELAQSAHPLVEDAAVAAAWGQEAFASASGVSALLRSASAETVSSLTMTLRQVIDPYRRRVLRAISPAWLVIDLDLTGLVVSDQATTYQGADFGYMGEVDGTGRGYQFARAQLASPQDTLVLGGFLHPGRTVEIHCLEELLALIEGTVGRPRRRVELFAGRIQELRERLAAVEAEITRRQKGNIFLRRHVKKWEAEREKLQAQILSLQTQRDALAAENAANPNPRHIILRMDGGFGHAAKLAWLNEQGYDFVARAHNFRVSQRLRMEDGLKWEKVSKNGFLAESKETSLGECPYPLRLFVSRQWWGDTRPERWSALVATPSLPAAAWPTRRIGVFYNGRQTIEAGIKEGKGLFASRHLPTRRQDGIAFYQELVLFAQNLVRWFRRQFLGHSILAAASIKELVRIGANSRAQLFHHHGELSLTFAADSPWQGITLPLNASVTYQLWLPAFDEWAAIRT